MGTDSELGWPDEKPAHRVRVDGFWMDATEVTNAQFRTFIQATGYVTTAEKPPSLEEIMSQSPPGTPPPPKEKLVPARWYEPIRIIRLYRQAGRRNFAGPAEKGDYEMAEMFLSNTAATAVPSRISCGRQPSYLSFRV